MPYLTFTTLTSGFTSVIGCQKRTKHAERLRPRAIRIAQHFNFSMSLNSQSSIFISHFFSSFISQKRYDKWREFPFRVISQESFALVVKAPRASALLHFFASWYRSSSDVMDIKSRWNSLVLLPLALLLWIFLYFYTFVCAAVRTRQCIVGRSVLPLVVVADIYCLPSFMNHIIFFSSLFVSAFSWVLRSSLWSCVLFFFLLGAVVVCQWNVKQLHRARAA